VTIVAKRYAPGDPAAMVRASRLLARRVADVLAGHDPGVQGAAMGECVALWLAGHCLAGDDFPLELLEQHTRLVKDLLPLEIKKLKDRIAAEGLEVPGPKGGH
jgi:hypothetical protein